MRQSTAPALRIIKLKPDFTTSTVTYTDGFGGAPGSKPALSETEIRDVIAFLKTLSDGYRIPASR